MPKSPPTIVIPRHPNIDYVQERKSSSPQLGKECKRESQVAYREQLKAGFRTRHAFPSVIALESRKNVAQHPKYHQTQHPEVA